MESIYLESETKKEDQDSPGNAFEYKLNQED